MHQFMLEPQGMIMFFNMFLKLIKNEHNFFDKNKKWQLKLKETNKGSQTHPWCVLCFYCLHK